MFEKGIHLSSTIDLHNNHNVYILGAGFSRLNGLPLINDFMLRMRDALEYHAQRGHRRECDAIKDVLEFRLNASSAAYRVQIDLENIEELFSLASASPTPIEENIRVAIAATLDFCVQSGPDRVAEFRAPDYVYIDKANWSCSASQTLPPEWHWRAPAYEYIVNGMLGNSQGLAGKLENTFITFNYDQIIENALTGLGVAYDLGLDGDSKSNNGTETRLLKLHGSMNWALPKRARSIVQVFDDYRQVIDAGLTPHLVPPTWKKDSAGSFTSIWRHALKALTDATRVVIVGFSMPPTDMHFKYLLATGLQKNYSLREIVFVSPGDGLSLVKSRCESLFAGNLQIGSQLRFVDSTIEAFMGQGTLQQRVWSISRPLPESVQGLSFGVGGQL